MTPTASLLVTGSIAYDHLSQFHQPFESVLLPDQLHKLSVCFFVPEKTQHFGGTAGNIAYSLALLGTPPRLFGAVGPDFGRYEEWMHRHGLETDQLQRAERDTACATIITDPRGNQIAEFYPGAMSTPVTQDRLTVLEGMNLLMISPEDPHRMKTLARAAHAQGIAYFFDPGQNLGLFSKEELEELMGHSSGVFLNDYEWELALRALDRSEEETLALCPLWVITLGEKGSKIVSRQEDGSFRTEVIPGVPVENAVNPTGCGDAYRAGFLRGYVEQRPLSICGRMGSLLGSYVVQKQGTQDHSMDWTTFTQDFERSFEMPL